MNVPLLPPHLPPRYEREAIEKWFASANDYYYSRDIKSPITGAAMASKTLTACRPLRYAIEGIMGAAAAAAADAAAVAERKLAGIEAPQQWQSDEKEEKEEKTEEKKADGNAEPLAGGTKGPLLSGNENTVPWWKPMAKKAQFQTKKDARVASVMRAKRALWASLTSVHSLPSASPASLSPRTPVCSCSPPHSCVIHPTPPGLGLVDDDDLIEQWVEDQSERKQA
jgi:hypothetical protein